LLLLFIPLFASGQKQVKVDWPSLAKSPWPVLRGDMQGTGRSEYVGPRTYNVKWVKDEPRGVLLGPVIGYDENLYFGEMAVHFEDSYNLFYAVDKNGNDLWTFKTQEFYSNMGGCVLGKDSTIYFHSANRYLYALNKDGKLKWSIYTVFSGFDELFMDKAGNIYLPAFDTLRVISPEGVMAKYYFPNIISPMSFSVGGDTMFVETGEYIGSQGGSLNATDLKGNVYWSYKFAYLGWGIPMVDNQNNVYVFGTDTYDPLYYLYCIRPDGTLKWRYPMDFFNKHYCPTMDYNGNITFFSPYRENGNVYAAITSLDYNGKVRWIDTLNAKDYYLEHFLMEYGPVCDKEGKIYCGSNMDGGTFYCIDSNGVILWKNIFPHEYDSCPAIGSDGTMYIGLQKGNFDFEQWATLYALQDTVTGVKDEKLEPVKDYQLSQNYPNPFNPTTTINYSIAKAGNVRLTVYNSIGSKVTTIVNEYKPAGNYSVQFNGSSLASGIYLYRLESGNYNAARKFILIK
jgi:outer membrane protein assembly factor BamB